MMAKEEGIPFGQNLEAQRRWKALIDWWEMDTGLKLGTPPEVPEGLYMLPCPSMSLGLWLDVSQGLTREEWGNQEENIPAWIGIDPEVWKVCQEANQITCSDECSWFKFLASMDTEEIQRQYDRHAQMTQLLNEIANEPGKDWLCYFHSADVYKAVMTLKDLSNLYKVEKARGKKYRTDPNAEFIRRIIKKLDELRTNPAGIKLSSKSIAVMLCLLNRTEEWWTDSPEWNWRQVFRRGTGELVPNVQSFIESEYFKKLDGQIRAARTKLRKKTP